MGNKRKKKEPTINETHKVPDIYTENISKLAEDLKGPPQIALGSFSSVILNTLHALGVGKHVTIEFNPDAYERPLHTLIMVSKSLEEEWGKDKVSEFTKEFYNEAMKEYSDIMSEPGFDVLDGEILAVHLTALTLAEEYGFDAIFDYHFDPYKDRKKAYWSGWILAKK
jgi:hypothetical protein